MLVCSCKDIISSIVTAIGDTTFFQFWIIQCHLALVGSKLVSHVGIWQGHPKGGCNLCYSLQEAILFFTYSLDRGFHLDLFTIVLNPTHQGTCWEFSNYKEYPFQYYIWRLGKWPWLWALASQGLCRGCFLSRNAIYFPLCFLDAYLYFKSLQENLPE